MGTKFDRILFHYFWGHSKSSTEFRDAGLTLTTNSQGHFWANLNPSMFLGGRPFGQLRTWTERWYHDWKIVFEVNPTVSNFAPFLFHRLKFESVPVLMTRVWNISSSFRENQRQKARHSRHSPQLANMKKPCHSLWWISSKCQCPD